VRADTTAASMGLSAGSLAWGTRAASGADRRRTGEAAIGQSCAIHCWGRARHCVLVAELTAGGDLVHGLWGVRGVGQL
jgi:hypothetical protein